MTTEIKIPEVGENISGGRVAAVLVKVGDELTAGQAILELETDKAVIEVPAPVSGKLSEIKVSEGDDVTIGQIVMLVEESDAAEETEEAADEAAAVTPVPPQAQEITSPAEELPHPPESVPLAPAVSQTAEPPADKKAPVPAAPSVRRFAREIGIDIHDVAGSGPAGRISIEDVKRFARQLNRQKGGGIAPAAGFAAEPLPDFTQWGAVEKQAMSKVRETTARHLSYAWSTVPQVTQFDKADITGLEALRKQYAPSAEKAGGKLTVTAILLKVVQTALKKFPQFNSSIDMAGKEIIFKKYFNIGVAADTERGLLVPVVRHVDQKNILELAVELTTLSRKARERKLSIEEMQGGNFTISNLGGIGGTGFTPIVNAPEVAILGVSRAEMQAVYRDGAFVPRLIMPLSLSYDHRIIDGADAARFLRWICRALEQPFLLSLEG